MLPTELVADARHSSALAVLGTMAIRATVILLLGAGVSYAARRLSAATRHVVWALTLGGALAVPALSVIVPRWEIPVAARVIDIWAASSFTGEPAGGARGADVPVATTPARPSEPTIGSAVDPTGTERARGRPGVAMAVAGASADSDRGLISRPAFAAAMRGAPSSAGEPWSRRAGTSASALLVGIWALGAFVAMLPTLAGVRRMAGVARRGRPVTARAWLSLVPTAMRDVGLARRVRFIRLDGAAMPMTWGIRRPVVLLPDDAFEATPKQRLDVLRHELAHVRRHDCLTQLIAQIACAVHWFNPLAWMAARAMRAERERACDDMVLGAGAKASEYAAYLLHVARSTHAPMAAPFGGMAMARPSQLGGRLRAVLDDRRCRSEVSRGVVARASLVAIGAVAVVSSITPAAAAAREAKGRSGTATRARPMEITVSDAGLIARASLPDEPARVPPANRVDLLPTARAAATPVAAGAGPCDRTSERSGNSSHRNSITSNNGSKRWRVVWSTGDCSYEIDARGDITYNRDVTDIATISRGGSFILEQHEGDDTRRLVVRPRDDGSLERSYSVNGARHEFDAAARTWLAEALVALDRQSAFAVDQRVPAILARGGVDAVLQEIALLGSDYARRRYSTTLLAARALNPAQVRRVVEQAGREMSSDYELAELLIDVSKRHAINDATRPIYLQAVGSIESDYEHRRVLAAIVAGGGLTPATTRALLEDARRIGSDYELAEFLVQIAKQGTLDASTRDAYFAAADKVRSDYEHHRALSPLVRRDLLTKEIAKAVLASAAKIDSDYECASLLVEVANAITIDDELRAAYERAAATIEGEYEYGRAMAAARG